MFSTAAAAAAAPSSSSAGAAAAAAPASPPASAPSKTDSSMEVWIEIDLSSLKLSDYSRLPTIERFLN